MANIDSKLREQVKTELRKLAIASQEDASEPNDELLDEIVNFIEMEMNSWWQKLYKAKADATNNDELVARDIVFRVAREGGLSEVTSLLLAKTIFQD